VTTKVREIANNNISKIVETLSFHAVEWVNAMDDHLGAVLLGTPLQIPIATLLANDTEADPTTLQIASVENAVNGSVALEDGVVSFQALPGYTGTASFDYTGIEPAGNESRATVTLTVVSQVELSAISTQTGIPTGTGGFIIQGMNTFDYTGFSVSDAGDVNGDGLADVVVGVPYADPNDQSRSGAAYLIYGKADGTAVDLNDVAAGNGGFAITGANVGDAAGWQVSGGGDINGDGLSDIVLGASFASVGDQFIAGKSYVIFGKTDTATVDLNDITAGKGGFVMNGIDFADRAGFSVSDAGDVNGDGLNDLIVGAYAAEYNNFTSAGEAYLVFGKTDGTPVELREVAAGNGGFIIEGTSAFDKLGNAVSSAGDLNGDGFDDLMIAAFEGDVTDSSNAGEIYIIFGKTETTPVNVADISVGNGGFSINGINAFDKAGTSVKNVGDVNGDGVADIIVGAPGVDVGTQLDAGAAYIIFGKTDTTAINLAEIAAGIGGFIINGNNAYDAAGTSVSGAGDVNGDGFDDVIVGATGSDPNNIYNAGEAYVIFGKSETTAVNLNEVAAGDGGFVLNGIRMYDSAGQSVSGAGDLNGDGFDDVIIGAPGYYSFYAPIYEGDSYVVFGGDFTASVTQQGTAGIDTLTGTAEGDILIGAQGDDLLSDGGFSNVILNGSAGDDILGINSTNFRQLKGGLGTDTLRLEAAGMNLDLTTLADHKITGIEIIDLAGNGNSLTLGMTDLIQLSDTSSTLRILGNSENTIRGNFAGFTTNTTLEGFTTYTNGTINLMVEESINQAGVIV
jgi:hypothetical protein